MHRNQNTYNRKRSYRLQGYDYSNEGMYFITINTKNREHFFGEINDNEVHLNSLGKIVNEEWLKTSDIRKEITLGEFVIMPDHFHALLLIDKQLLDKSTTGNYRTNTVKAHGHAPLLAVPYKNKFGPQSKNLSALVRSFKASCTKRIRLQHPHFSWQKSFHDRIVRDEHELLRIEDYIRNNPIKATIRRLQN
ncbi:MAG: hypothetical protein JJ966_08555 [Balneolaceae bacterium]|nr:hypothetical protein [Balneolaceae bacterium]